MFDNLKLNLKPKSLGGDNVCYKITHGYQTEDKHDIPLKEQKYTVYKGNVKKEYIVRHCYLNDEICTNDCLENRRKSSVRD